MRKSLLALVACGAFLSLAPTCSAEPPVQSDPVTLRIEPSYFSPNDDGVQDQIFFYPVLANFEGIRRWRLELRSLKHGSARMFSGTDLPALITWDGRDKKGVLCQDGEYRAKLTVRTKDHNLIAEDHFFIDTQPPVVQLSVSTPVIDQSFLQNQTVAFTPIIKDMSPIDRWQLQILDQLGRTVYLFWSTEPVWQIRWNGRDQSTGILVPKGRYRCAFQVWDKAGNESATAFSDLVVDLSPKQFLEQALKKIQVSQTSVGMVVQLSGHDLFDLQKGKPVLRPDAREWLRESALLINAYPDMSVRLDGYSASQKNADQDRELSDLYAWNVYNHFVKSGNVRASRFSVQGQGRAVPAARKRADPPPPKNGIEIILENRGEW